MEDCKHEHTHAMYDHMLCKDCSWIKTDSCWGQASNKWFPSMQAAEHYQQHGEPPADLGKILNEILDELREINKWIKRPL